MLTPPKYWRLPCVIGTEFSQPANEIILPDLLATRSAPPVVGHGIAIAAYDEAEQIGLFRWLGLVTDRAGASRTVVWKPTDAQIWIDTGFGRSKWKAGAFGFANSKIAGYGLHELWYTAFDELELRDHRTVATKPTGQTSSRIKHVSPERLNPIEVIGEPTTGPRAGVVYLLKSAYGYKVGRTGSIPNRMRAFGIQLPIVYSIPLCVWFGDCHLAERRYHQLFANKRINGEWFDLTDEDIDLIRMKA